MNAEAQKLMDTINRLMAKGMSRDDDTIKTLEGLIKEELDKGETDDAFLQQPNRPQVERPGMKDEGVAPEEFERQNPNWREDEVRMDREQQDLNDVMRMMYDWKSGPDADKFELSENMGGIYDQGIPPGTYKNMNPNPQTRNFRLPSQYGIENIKRGLDYEFEPTEQISQERKSFQRPGAGPSTEEELEMIMPEELEEEYN